MRARDYILTYAPSYGSYSTPPHEARADALAAIDVALAVPGRKWSTLSDEDIIAGAIELELEGDIAKIFAGGALWATNKLAAKNGK